MNFSRPCGTHSFDAGDPALKRRAIIRLRSLLGGLEELTENRIEVIHIVGGGCQSKMLNQFTADACERPVIAGPVEATAMGNLLVQVRASGELGSLAEIREVIGYSTQPVHYKPADVSAWRATVQHLASL